VPVPGPGPHAAARPLGIRDAAALLERDSAGELSAWIADGFTADLLVSPWQQIAIRHDLIRESVHAGIPGAVRVALHRQCAEYLLATGHGHWLRHRTCRSRPAPATSGP